MTGRRDCDSGACDVRVKELGRVSEEARVCPGLAPQELVPEGRERGSPETGGAPVHTGKLPHRRAQRGAAKSWKTGQSRDVEGRKQRKLHFSAP